jgi:hypothetical protein
MEMGMITEYCVGVSIVSVTSNEKLLCHEQPQLILSNTNVSLNVMRFTYLNLNLQT